MSGAEDLVLKRDVASDEIEYEDVTNTDGLAYRITRYLYQQPHWALSSTGQRNTLIKFISWGSIVQCLSRSFIKLACNFI